MGVKLKKSIVRPEVELDFLHVDQLLIKHQRKDESPTIIEGYGAAYGKLNNKKYFDTNLIAINCPDIHKKIFEDHVKLGKTEQECYIEYITIKTELMNKYSNGEITDWTLMIMFELAIGRIFEILSSRVEIDNII